MTEEEINDVRVGMKELMAVLADVGEKIGKPAAEVDGVRHSISPAVDELCDLALKGLAQQRYVSRQLTTHELLEDAAVLLEDHGQTSAAGRVRSGKSAVPDVPISSCYISSSHEEKR